MRIEGEYKGTPRIGDVKKIEQPKPKRKGKGRLYHRNVAAENAISGLVGAFDSTSNVAIEGVKPGAGTTFELFPDSKPRPQRQRRSRSPRNQDKPELLNGLEEAINATFAQTALADLLGSDVVLEPGFDSIGVDLPEIL